MRNKQPARKSCGGTSPGGHKVLNFKASRKQAPPWRETDSSEDNDDSEGCLSHLLREGDDYGVRALLEDACWSVDGLELMGDRLCREDANTLDNFVEEGNGCDVLALHWRCNTVLNSFHLMVLATCAHLSTFLHTGYGAKLWGAVQKTEVAVSAVAHKPHVRDEGDDSGPESELGSDVGNEEEQEQELSQLRFGRRDRQRLLSLVLHLVRMALKDADAGDGGGGKSDDDGRLAWGLPDVVLRPGGDMQQHLHAAYFLAMVHASAELRDWEAAHSLDRSLIPEEGAGQELQQRMAGAAADAVAGMEGLDEQGLKELEALLGRLEGMEHAKAQALELQETVRRKKEGPGSVQERAHASGSTEGEALKEAVDMLQAAASKPAALDKARDGGSTRKADESGEPRQRAKRMRDS